MTEHAEGETVGSDILDAAGWRTRNRIAAQTPDEHADNGNIEASLTTVRCATTDVNRMCAWIERTVDAIKRSHVAHRGGAEAIKMGMIEVLCAVEQLEEFNGSCGPASHVADEVFEQGDRALATTIADQLGDFASRNQHAIEGTTARIELGRRRPRFRDGLVAEQIGDIGHHPVIAGFDEPVIVQM